MTERLNYKPHEFEHERQEFMKLLASPIDYDSELAQQLGGVAFCGTDFNGIIKGTAGPNRSYKPPEKISEEGWSD